MNLKIKGLVTGREDDPRKQNNFLLGLHAEILACMSCDQQAEKEITCKMMGDNNKHAIWAPLLSSLLLITTFFSKKWQFFTTGGAKRN